MMSLFSSVTSHSGDPIVESQYQRIARPLTQQEVHRIAARIVRKSHSSLARWRWNENVAN